MRAALVSGIVGRRDLRQRVTIADRELANMPWPDRLGDFVAVAMLGHIGPGERTTLWGQLAERLADGAPAIVHL